MTLSSTATSPTPHVIAKPPVVTLSHVSIRYAGNNTTTVNDITGEIHPGTVTLLCGDSGCGKTTLIRAINGLVPHYYDTDLTGSLTVCGEQTHHIGIDTLARHVGSVFQHPGRQCFTTTVRDELAFACENFAIPPEQIRTRVARTLNDFDLQHVAHRHPAMLSGGQQQRVACAAASLHEPEVIVMDEPSSNLDAASIHQLRGIVARWKQQGYAIVIAEHRLYWLDGLIDTAWYMRDGSILHRYTGEQLHALPVEQRKALGLRPTTVADMLALPHVTQTHIDDEYPYDEQPTSSPHLHRPLTDAWTFDGARYTYRHSTTPALDIRHIALLPGTITAIVGGNGAGKTTFARCLQGLDARCQGVLHSPQGHAYRRKQRLRQCFTVLQDTSRELFTPSVVEEILVAQPREREQDAYAILQALDLESMAHHHPMSLSGGQQQRVAIGAALACERPIIIVDEPTSGLDMRHMRQVAQLLRWTAQQGRTVVVITHDAEFALCACDRAVMVRDGSVTDDFPLDNEGRQRLLDLLLG